MKEFTQFVMNRALSTTLVFSLTLAISAPVFAARKSVKARSLVQQNTNSGPVVDRQQRSTTMYRQVSSPAVSQPQSPASQVPSAPAQMPDFSKLFDQIGGGSSSMPDFSKLFDQVGSQIPSSQMPSAGLPDLDKLFEQFGGGQIPQLPTSGQPGAGQIPDLDKVLEQIGGGQLPQIPVDLPADLPKAGEIDKSLSCMNDQLNKLEPALKEVTDVLKTIKEDQTELTPAQQAAIDKLMNANFEGNLEACFADLIK